VAAGVGVAQNSATPIIARTKAEIRAFMGVPMPGAV
jgi:hypothetical protein